MTMNAEIMHLDLPDHQPSTEGPKGQRLNPALLNDLKVSLDIRLGTREIPVRELMSLQTGSLVELDRTLHEDVDVLLNGQVVARGQMVAVGDRFGVRITAIQAED